MSDRFDYAVEPFRTIFLSRRGEISKLVQVGSYAFKFMDGASRLATVLKRGDEHVAFLQQVEETAADERAADFPLLHGTGVILIWGALEAAVRDFLVRWLTVFPDERKIPELQKIRVSVGEYDPLSEEERMRYVVGIAEREWSAALKPGAGRFDSLLKPFGLAPDRPAELTTTLLELAATRNVIVHRASVADKKFVDLCPWLNASVGQRVNVGSSDFQRFIMAASEYAALVVTKAQQRSNAETLSPAAS